MKRRITLILGALFLMIVCIGESRSFYCLGDNKCVTVWKTFGGICYVIPGRYYGLIEPRSRSYIKTTNKISLDIIWPSKTNNVIADFADGEKVIKNTSEGPIIIDYASRAGYHDSLFTHFDGKYHRYKKDLTYINISIPDNVAVNSKGEKL